MAKRRRKLRPLTPTQSFTLAMILASNLLPVAGVLLFNWSLFDVFFLYWLENIYIGIQCKRRIDQAAGSQLVEEQNQKFTETYAVFMFAHFVMLFVFAPRIDLTQVHRPLEFFAQVFLILKDTLINISWAAVFVILNRFFSWRKNIASPEEEPILNDYLNASSTRLLVLQGALIIGAYCAFMNAARYGIWAMAFIKAFIELDEHHLLGVTAEEKKKLNRPPDLRFKPR